MVFAEEGKIVNIEKKEFRKSPFKSVIVSELKTEKKQVFLTLDDGWDKKLIEKAINILIKEEVKATLFPVGSAIKANPEIWKKAINSGIEIGNHTSNHSMATKVTDSAYIKSISDWNSIAKKYLGYETKWFRPPGMYGFTSSKSRTKYSAIISEFNLDVALWSDKTDTYYYLYRKDPKIETQKVIDYIVKETKPGTIILMHFNGKDVAALEGIIKGLKKKDYEFLTLSEGFPRQ